VSDSPLRVRSIGIKTYNHCLDVPRSRLRERSPANLPTQWMGSAPGGSALQGFADAPPISSRLANKAVEEATVVTALLKESSDSVRAYLSSQLPRT
jgi:hypothetical protein